MQYLVYYFFCNPLQLTLEWLYFTERVKICINDWED